MTAKLIRLKRLPEGLERVPLDLDVNGPSAQGTSYVKGTKGFLWMNSTHGRDGWHWDSQDFSECEITIAGNARTYYFDFQDLRDQGWANLTGFGPRGEEAALLNLPRLGIPGNHAHDYIALEFEKSVEWARLQVNTTGGHKSNGFAILGLLASPARCPDRVKLAA